MTRRAGGTAATGLRDQVELVGLRVGQRHPAGAQRGLQHGQPLARVHQVGADLGQVLGSGGEHRDGRAAAADGLRLLDQLAGHLPPQPALQPGSHLPRLVADERRHRRQHVDLVETLARQQVGAGRRQGAAVDVPATVDGDRRVPAGDGAGRGDGLVQPGRRCPLAAEGDPAAGVVVHRHHPDTVPRRPPAVARDRAHHGADLGEGACPGWGECGEHGQRWHLVRPRQRPAQQGRRADREPRPARGATRRSTRRSSTPARSRATAASPAGGAAGRPR